MKKNVTSKKKIINGWVKYFSDTGLSSDIISDYEKYISTLVNNGVPVIFELEHLSKLVCINLLELTKIINGPEKFYRNFYIPKRKGGNRLISSPYPSLKQCQLWVYNNILLQFCVHDKSHGFVKNRSIITNAKTHLNKFNMLKMDLEDFFPSIPFSWVMNFFLDAGYAKNVSFYLSSICCLNGGLGQGAPTSPFLSNLLLYRLDERLSKVAKSFELDYTRYADDLTFSGNYIPLSFSNIVANIITDYGLSVNHDKTSLCTNKGKRIVTGLSVKGREIKVPRHYKRELRQCLHYIKEYGFASHLSRMKIKDPNYIDSLIGKFSFWLQIEPECQYARESINYLNSLKV